MVIAGSSSYIRAQMGIIFLSPLLLRFKLLLHTCRVIIASRNLLKPCQLPKVHRLCASLLPRHPLYAPAIAHAGCRLLTFVYTYW